jgi:hypothetical protein
MLVGMRFRAGGRLSRIGCAILGLGMVAWHAPLAVACSLRPPPEHVTDPQAQASDATAPDAPAVAVSKIGRGKGQAACSNNSCEGNGTIVLEVSASDDQAPTDKLGYQIELVSGQLPPGLQLPTKAIRALGGEVWLHWNDGDTDEQEAFSFSLAVRAVDLAGNVGPASTASVQDGGSTGCSVGRHAPGSAWQLTTIAILLLARLSRTRTGRGPDIPSSDDGSQPANSSI